MAGQDLALLPADRAKFAGCVQSRFCAFGASTSILARTPPPFWLYFFAKGDVHEAESKSRCLRDSDRVGLAGQRARWGYTAHSRSHLHGQPPGTLGLGFVGQRNTY